ncbi:hypothetical protein TRVL_08456 [Trypanosoma vivax]|nr:hypothetical protein TRVL_08456 [Trypanosoma vivax]
MCLLDESEQKNKAPNQASCKSTASVRATNPSDVEARIEDSYRKVGDAFLLEGKTLRAAGSGVTEKQEDVKSGVVCDSVGRSRCFIVISFHPGVVRLNARRVF